MFTYDMIIHLNIALADASLNYKIRYLNGSEAGIEPMGHCCCEETEGLFSEFIFSYFKKLGIETSANLQTYKITVK